MGDAQVHLAPTAIDDGPRREDPRLTGTDRLQDLPGGATGGDHVLDDDDGIARREDEPATEGHRAVLSLGEQARAPEGPGHLVGDQDSTECRRHDRGQGVLEEGPQPVGQGRPEGGGEGWVHQDARTLEVSRRVEPGREEEVALEESPPLAEESLQADVRFEVEIAHGG